MTTFQIKCFLAAASHLNFTEAANEMFIAQSSLSRNISNLEKEIGMQLFARTKKYVRLTPAGAVLYEEFQKLLEASDAALEKARQANISTQASLSLGIVESQKTESFLPHALGILRKKYSNVDISFIRGNFKEMRESLEHGNIDISITLGFDIDSYLPYNVVYQSILRSTPLCAISKYHPLANARSIRLEDLRNDDLITISPGISQGGYQGMVELCKLHGFTPNKIKTTQSTEQISLMIQGGEGFSIIDNNSTLCKNESLRCLPVKNGNTINLVAIWKKENYNPAISLFINLLTSQDTTGGGESNTPV
ncbi:MAG: LysR family transcriptional regulator [Eubacterium sp.]|nr:LysR family transcriptional regulator [Eubacterium sp.]